jgi:hypothetical protein
MFTIRIKIIAIKSWIFACRVLLKVQFRIYEDDAKLGKLNKHAHVRTTCECSIFLVKGD